MLTFLVHQPLIAIGFATLAALALVLALGLRIIHEHESGLVIKRFGRPLAPGRIVATDGEAGYQAVLLPPGWHFPIWRWQYKVQRVYPIIIPYAFQTAYLPQEMVRTWAGKIACNQGI